LITCDLFEKFVQFLRRQGLLRQGAQIHSQNQDSKAQMFLHTIVLHKILLVRIPSKGQPDGECILYLQGFR
jgi:hypothetical protein